MNDHFSNHVAIILPLLLLCGGCMSSISVEVPIQMEADEQDSYRIELASYQSVELMQKGILKPRNSGPPMIQPELIAANQNSVFVYDEEVRNIFIYDHNMKYLGLLMDDPIPDDVVQPYGLEVDNEGVCYLSFFNYYYVIGNQTARYRNLYGIAEFIIHDGYIFAINYPGLLATRKDGLVNVFTDQLEFVRTIGSRFLPSDLKDSAHRHVCLAANDTCLAVVSCIYPTYALIDLGTGQQIEYSMDDVALIARGENNINSYRKWQNGNARSAWTTPAALGAGFVSDRLIIACPNAKEFLFIQSGGHGGIEKVLYVENDENLTLFNVKIMALRDKMRIYLVLLGEKKGWVEVCSTQ